jgi:hypothetical protein
MSSYFNLHKMIKYAQKQKKDAQEQMNENIQKLVKNAEKLSVVHFKIIHQYVKSKFPDVDITHIPIYLVPDEDMDKAFRHAGGCFIPSHEAIFVRMNMNFKPKGKMNKFDKELNSRSIPDVSTEDVLVHEMMHAVSHVSGRSGRSFNFNEEEFAYTNTVDFYLSRGMTRDEIVRKNFLPFCINNVMEVEMNNIIGTVSPEFLNTPKTPSAMKVFMTRNAEKLVDIIVDKATQMGKHMIELYDKQNNMFPKSDLSDKKPEKKRWTRFSILRST